MNDHQDLILQVSKQLKPQYLGIIKKGGSSETAYLKIYPQAVNLVAKKLGFSVAKTKFAARDILQMIIREITS